MLKRAWTNKDGRINLRFSSGSKSKFIDILDKIKDIPGREWDSENRIWRVPFTKENIKRLKKLEFKFSDKLKGKIEDKKKEKTKRYVDPILRDYQIDHANKLVEAIKEYGGALDGSDTGTGKTFVALSVAKHLKRLPIVVTPKSVIPNWKDVSKLFKVNCFASNYEQYRIGGTAYLSCGTEIKKDKEVKTYNWKLPENSLLIFDEVHRCKDHKTINAHMLAAAADQNIKILCLSATVGDNPTHFYAVGRAIRMFSTVGQFMSWMYRRGIKKNPFGAFYFSKKAQKKYLPKIHSDIYKSRGSRITVEELGDRFPENLIISEAYDMDSKSVEEINRLYAQMQPELDLVSEAAKQDEDMKLTANLRERQQIELLKVPLFVELAQDHIEEGMSVAIFVNFTETIRSLSEKLNTTCIIDGTIVGNGEQREANRKKFHTDKSRIIILNIKAGGEGISLHDIRGEFPRVGIISPTYSAIDLVQLLGRLPRDGAKSKVIQKLIFASGTVEEEAAKRVKRKVDNIKTINDGDLV